MMVVDKELELKVQDDLRLEKEFYPETKVKSFSKRPASIVSTSDVLAHNGLFS